MLLEIGIALAAASIASGVAGGMQQKEAAQAQRDAQRSETAMAQEQNRKNAVQAIRQARIKNAAIQAASYNTGSRGSGMSGAMGSVTSQLGSAVGFQRMQAQNASNISDYLANAAQHTGKANAYGQASQFFGNASLTAFGKMG